MLQALLTILLRESSAKELELVFLNDSDIRAYYKKYFGKNRPTDVIAFPANDPSFIGSIVISVDTAKRQARENGQSLWNEIRLLVIHGFLHLVGYDHARPKDAKVMREREMELMRLTEMVNSKQ